MTGILGAGGIAVLSHPSTDSEKLPVIGEALERRLKKLMSYGLKGVEVFNPVLSGEQKGELLSFAEKNGLYITAGSTYHGRKGKAVPGDTGLDALTELPDGFRRFLGDVCYLH